MKINWKAVGVGALKMIVYLLIAIFVAWIILGRLENYIHIHDFDQLGIIDRLYLQNVLIVFLGCVILEKLRLIRKDIKNLILPECNEAESKKEDSPVFGADRNAD